MTEAVICVLALIAVALFLQDKLGVPTPISLILLVLAGVPVGLPEGFMDDARFDGVVALMLPVLICVDALMLRWHEIRRNALPLIYLAGIMVVLSVGLAMLLDRMLLPSYHLGTAAVAALFCMISATDPVSVSSVFGKRKLPHNLKIMAEGESLFNDATALIIFSIALTYMGHGGDHAVDNVTLFSLRMVAGALAVGLLVGYLGLMALRFVHNAMAETMIVLVMAYGAFVAAEHWHASGILAVIVAILFANNVITGRLRQGEEMLQGVEEEGAARAMRGLLVNFETMVKDASDYQVIVGNVRYTAMLASGILFIAMAQIIDLDLLWRYRGEIASVFIGSTLIRMAMLGLFAGLSGLTDKVPTIPLHWWKVLTAAGVKGAFSLLMLHMIPRDYEFREMFEAIVVGQVLLSTFLYPSALIAVIRVHSKVLAMEYRYDRLRYEE